MDYNTIYGQVPSKPNCYKIISFNGHASLAKSKGLRDYEDNFFLQCRIRDKMIEGLFELDIDVYCNSMRHDLDNTLKIILDCLQKVKAIKNDNKCIKIVAQKFIDKVNPRIEFKLIKNE